jgi:maltooligosyltrehalose trehalohydrolase
VPDPQDKETFLRSKLDWSQPAGAPYRSLLEWHRSLLALRRSRPELTDPRFDRVRVSYDEGNRWLAVYRGPLTIMANFGDATACIPLNGSRAARPDGATVLLASQPGIVPDSAGIHVPPFTFGVIDSKNLP